LSHPAAVWLGFTGLVALLLILDLGILNRRAHVLSNREALAWSGGLITLALLFGAFLWYREGAVSALEYYTGYLIELSLSVDNLFVFILIFQYFAVPSELQPRVLKWGILGAIVMRGAMIALGSLVLLEFEWVLLLFGAILVVTGIRMFRGGEERIEPEKNPIIRLARRVLPIANAYNGQSFVVRGPRGWLATPLVVVILFVEWSDLVFAIDSIPAVFAVTRDPFIVYSSNVFAILGLRALYFLLAGALDRFRYLKPGVALILVFVGVKMLVGEWVHLPTVVSLAVVVVVLSFSVAASLLWSGPAAERLGRVARTPAVPAGRHGADPKR
jgi:tellurite resistance protein TerC